MRKIAIIAALVLGLALIAGMAIAAKDTPVKVVLDDVKKDVKPAAFQRGNTVYLPMRATANLVKASIAYDKNNKLYTITSGKKKTVIKESVCVKVNGQAMVSFDLMSKALDCGMKWDNAAKAVYITTKSAKPDKDEVCPPSAGG